MNTSSKIDRLIANMAAAGIPKGDAFPPLWRVLWIVGVKLPPPLFLGFFPIALVFGGYFGLGFAFITWLLQGVGFLGVPAFPPSLYGLLTGIPFGLYMASQYRDLAEKHNLGTWSEFQIRGCAPNNSLKRTDQSLRD